MLRELGGSQVANRKSWAVVHLPAGPHASSVCMMMMGWEFNSKSILFFPREENGKKKMQAESKYLVQAGLRGGSTGPSRLSMLVRGSGVAVWIFWTFGG